MELISALFRLNLLRLTLFSLVILLLSTANAYAEKLVSIDTKQILVCQSLQDDEQVNWSDKENCQQKSLHEINPQQKALWVKANIELPPQYSQNQIPLALYLFGKTSSEVYFNGVSLGQNGTPSAIARNEFIGKMDARFYVPNKLIKAGNNEMILRLSSHHGLLTLAQPMHFIGLGEYGETTVFFQRNITISLALLGTLMLGAVYLLALSFKAEQRQSYQLLFCMALFSSAQLIVEISRGLFNYSYPVHDLRLIGVVALSLAFSLCLLAYMLIQLNSTRKFVWLSYTLVITTVFVAFTPGFDGKATIAILVPSLTCLMLISHAYLKQRTKALLTYLLTFSAFVAIMLINFSAFHDMLFYYLITAMMVYLFIQQANQLVQEQALRREEQENRHKLQFKLEQNQQQQAPSKLTITSAGKTEILASQDIIFCKAAGDYV